MYSCVRYNHGDGINVVMKIRRRIDIGPMSSCHFDVDPTSDFHQKINNHGATIIANIRVVGSGRKTGLLKIYYLCL